MTGFGYNVNGFGAYHNREVTVTASNASSVNLQTIFTDAHPNSWLSSVVKRYIIPSDVVLGITTVPASMGGTLIIDNSGDIQGVGGTANGGVGATAMTVQSTGVTINMLSGSTLSGGGGGGGQGGTGGNGAFSTAQGSGFQFPGCVKTSSGPGDDDTFSCATTGGSGGAGGVGAGYGQSQANGAAGGSSSGFENGRNAGDGGAGGNGAAFGAVGSTGANGANGTGTSGGAGSTGGAAGRAITFSGVSAYTIIGTDSGTINGAYT